MLLPTNYIEKYFLLSVCLLAAGLWLPIVFTNVLITVSLCLWVANIVFNKFFIIYVKNYIVAGMVMFFAIHALSAMYSNNTIEGWHIVERRLPLIAFPVLFFNNTVNNHFQLIIKGFIGGVCVALLFCLGIALYKVFLYNQTQWLFYHQLSAPIKINAVYLSAYVVAATFWVYNSLFKRPFIKSAILVLLVIGCLLLSSKTMLAILCMGLMCLSIIRVKKYTAIAFALAIGISVLLLPNIRQRFSLEYHSNLSVVNLKQYRYDTPFTGLTLRLVIWKHCANIIHQQHAWLFGVGTGDFQDELNATYKATNMYTGNVQLGDTGYLNYGPHNQYVEIFFSMGVVGLLVLFTHLLLIVVRLKHTDMVSKLLFAMLLIAMLSECIISTNKGILLYAFVVCCIIPTSNTLKKYCYSRV